MELVFATGARRNSNDLHWNHALRDGGRCLPGNDGREFECWSFGSRIFLL